MKALRPAFQKSLGLLSVLWTCLLMPVRLKDPSRNKWKRWSSSRMQIAMELVRQKILASSMAGIRLEGGTALGFFRTSQCPTSNPHVLLKHTHVFISEICFCDYWELKESPTVIWVRSAGRHNTNRFGYNELLSVLHQSYFKFTNEAKSINDDNFNFRFRSLRPPQIW